MATAKGDGVASNAELTSAKKDTLQEEFDKIPRLNQIRLLKMMVYYLIHSGAVQGEKVTEAEKLARDRANFKRIYNKWSGAFNNAQQKIIVDRGGTLDQITLSSIATLKNWAYSRMLIGIVHPDFNVVMKPLVEILCS